MEKINNFINFTNLCINITKDEGVTASILSCIEMVNKLLVSNNCEITINNLSLLLKEYPNFANLLYVSGAILKLEGTINYDEKIDEDEESDEDEELNEEERKILVVKEIKKLYMKYIILLYNELSTNNISMEAVMKISNGVETIVSFFKKNNY
jgi:hypothetical protein